MKRRLGHYSSVSLRNDASRQRGPSVQSLIEPSLAWAALFALLFAAVGLHGHVLRVVPLHFGAISSAGAVTFLLVDRQSNSMGGALLSAFLVIFGLNFLSIAFARSSRWLRAADYGQLIVLVAFGGLVMQALVLIDGNRFYTPPIASADAAEAVSDTYRAVAIGALTCVALLLLLDVRRIRIRLHAVSVDPVRAALSGVNVAVVQTGVVAAVSFALVIFSIGAAYMRGHQAGIDIINVILASAVALVWRASRIWQFAILGALFAVARVICGEVAGVRWQDVAAFALALGIIGVAAILRRDAINRVRGDGIHNPLSSDR